MNKIEQKPEKDILLEEYRQLMESQRDNTRITYSWISNIILVLSSALFIFGLTTDVIAKFIPAMTLGILLAFVWGGLTSVFARYIRDRFNRLEQICDELRIPQIPPPATIPNKWIPLTVAKTYVILFVIFYVIAWVIRLVLGFIV